MGLAIDLFCGLGGWTEGLQAEGWDVIGFDNERHEYWAPDIPETGPQKGTRPIEKRGWTQGCAVSLGLEGASKRPPTKLHRYPAQLVVQDVLTLHGSQFKDVGLIVASPPCQEYSYMAMPWTRAKQIARGLKGEDEFPEGYKGSRTIEDLNKLFNACFRIQREACEAAGRHIPMVVENVKGAQPWVGRAKWNFGSYYLWGDVPALMPIIPRRSVMKDGIPHRPNGATNFHRDLGNGCKNPGFRFDGSGRSFQTESVKNTGDSSFNVAHNKVPSLNGGRRTDVGNGARFTSENGSARKHASAMIAKIPFELARHIGAVYKENPPSRKAMAG